MIGKWVIIRTYSAGVHFGKLFSMENKVITLTEARRIWHWKGAYTLSEVAAQGIKKGSKVSVVVPSIVLTEAIEIIECTAAGAENLRCATWDS